MSLCMYMHVYVLPNTHKCKCVYYAYIYIQTYVYIYTYICTRGLLEAWRLFPHITLVVTSSLVSKDCEETSGWWLEDLGPRHGVCYPWPILAEDTSSMLTTDSPAPFTVMESQAPRNHPAPSIPGSTTLRVQEFSGLCVQIAQG